MNMFKVNSSNSILEWYFILMFTYLYLKNFSYPGEY